jgi:hypothetical protein
MGKGENNEGEDISNTKTSSVVLISTYKKVSFAFRITKTNNVLSTQWPDISLSLEKALKLKRHIVSPLVNSFDKREYEMGTCHEPFSEGNLAIQYEASAQNAVRESPEEYR